MLLIDTDVLFKLCSWDLLDLSLLSLNETDDSCLYLDALPYQFSRPSKNSFWFEIENGRKDRLGQFIQNGKALDLNFPVDVANRLANIPGIDPGEASLLTATIANANCTLLTGDRKSIAAMVTFGGNDYINALRGRVLCLERVLLDLSSTLGLTHIRGAVLLCPDADKAIPICIGRYTANTVVDFECCLNGYLTETDPNGLLNL